MDEDGGVIAKMGRLMSEAGGSMFRSDQVRYSAKIEAAVKELKQLRDYITDNAQAWEAQIAEWQRQLQYGPDAADAKSERYIGRAVTELFTDSSQPVNAKGQVIPVTASNTRLSRLSLAANDEADSTEATITVISKDQVCISLVTGGDAKGKGVANVPVKVKDILNDTVVEETCQTDDSGLVVLSVNKFTSDMYDVIHVRLEVDPREQGYRNFMIEDLDLAQGEIYTATLQPMNGAVTNAQGQQDDPPYLVSACFNRKDIMLSDYEMIYSTANNYNFDIRVEVANADGQPDLVMKWYENDGRFGDLKECWAEATTHEGNVYTFTGPWKSKFSPNASQDQRPTFSFGRDGDISFTSPPGVPAQRHRYAPERGCRGWGRVHRRAWARA